MEQFHAKENAVGNLIKYFICVFVCWRWRIGFDGILITGQRQKAESKVEMKKKIKETANKNGDGVEKNYTRAQTGLASTHKAPALFDESKKLYFV